MECVIYRSFLHKTPPLDKLIVTWKRKWFVLSQKDPFNPRSVELSYYSDSDESGKKGTIDLAAITRIHPSPSKAKGYIFSIELRDKKIMLKADDAKTKNIWIAKLYEFAGQGHNYHVTVPHQPTAPYSEGLLQLGKSDHQVTIFPPTSSSPILNIPFTKVRRFGYKVVLDSYDVIWFELCLCREREQEFCFFVVASGMDRAMLIVNDLKSKIESSTGRFLILEEDMHPECTFISRLHYGCFPYPKAGRERIMHSGLVNLEAYKMVTSSDKRRPSEAPMVHQPVANERRNTVMTLLGKPLTPNTSPSPSPSHSPSPTPGGLSLHHLSRRSPVSPGSTSDPASHSAGMTLGEFEKGRYSDGGYLALSDSASLLSNWKSKRPVQPASPRGGTLERVRHTRTTLNDLHTGRVSGRSGSHDNLLFPSKDSGIGTSADLVVESEARFTGPYTPPPVRAGPYPSSPARTGQYTVLPAVTAPRTRDMAYDHLNPVQKNPPIPPRSNVSLFNGSRNAAYIDA